MMAVWSEVLLSELAGARRLDAEYYQPVFTENVSRIHATTARGFSVRRISDLIHSIRGSAFYPALVEHYDTEGTPFLRVSDLGEFFVKEDAVIRVQPKVLKEYKTISHIRPGSIVIAKGGTIGLLSFVQPSLAKCAICRDVIAIEPDERKVNPIFLLLYLKAKPGQLQLERNKSQQVQAHLTFPAVSNIEVAIPPREFQDRVAEIVEHGLGRLSDSKRIYAEAEGLLSSALGLDGLDLTARLFYERPYADLEAAARFDAEYFQPAHEEVINCCKAYKDGWTTLGDLMTGITNGVECRSFVEDGVPYLRVGDIESLWLNAENASKIGHEDANRLRSKISLQPDDVVMVRSGSIGQTAVVPDDVSDAILSSHLIRLRQHSPLKVRPLCLALLLSSQVGVAQTKKHNNGGIVPEISQSAVRQFVVPLLDESLQSDLEKSVQSSFAARREARRLLDEAKRLVEDAILKGE